MINKYVHKENYYRAIITDTLPFDLPIIINNEGFYDNSMKEDRGYATGFFEKIIESKLDKSDPIEFNISKGSDSVRKLSLPHPSIQYHMSKFYEQYSDLICYYTSLSPISIRSPFKKSSTYYKGASFLESKYKGDNIERDETDFSHKHSISFFKYNGFNRIYKFFSSGKYYQLEKKYPVFWCMDVSKCFESIYTHSISWATKSKEIIKQDGITTIDAMFGQRIDTLMQKSNKNETNGIIIGPEFSRIFAEIILQDVDLKCIKKLEDVGLEFKKDYEVCRYIDDIFIFAKNEHITKVIFDRFSDELRKYNLHVNESKTKKYTRPFVTSKSRTILKLNEEINKLSQSLYNTIDGNVELTNVYSHFNISNRFIDKIKSICIDTNSTYNDVSNYVISSLEQRVRKLVFLFEMESEEDEDVLNYRYIEPEDERSLYRILLVFINIIFHMYSVSHSVTSSYVVSRCCLVATKFLDDIKSDYSLSLKERIFCHIIDFAEIYQSSQRDGHLPLEIINLILITTEFGDENEYEYQFSEHFLDKLFFSESGGISYFNAVSLMYYIKRFPIYRELHRKLNKAVKKKIDKCTSFSKSSSDFHLAMDMICCPYIDNKDRSIMLNNITKVSSIQINKADINDALAYFEANPWFVNWKRINLFNLLEKKLLKSVY